MIGARLATALRACALASAIAPAGCSFLVMRDAPAVPSPAVEPDCSTSRMPPVADIGGAAMALLAATLSAVVANTDNGSGAAPLAAVGMVGTIGFIASSVSGFRKSDRCHRAREAWSAMRAWPPYGPVGPMAPPPPPAPAGGERGSCRTPPAPVCEPGLTCASGYCVRMPAVAPTAAPAPR